MSLEVATEGPCEGHPCDRCYLCLHGHCCRKDKPVYELPKIGDWKGLICGDLGVLSEDALGEKVQCHICGEWFEKLGNHIVWEHDVFAQEYRAYFGLRQSTPLCSLEYSERVRAANTERLERIRPKVSYLATMTAEQRSALKKGTELPLETLRDAGYRATMKRVGEKTTARAQKHKCYCGCGELLPPGNGPHRGQRYLHGHAPLTLADRVAAFLDSLRGSADPSRSCSEILETFLEEEGSQVRRALGHLVRKKKIVRLERGIYASATDKEEDPG